jgi:hypothetical protein
MENIKDTPWEAGVVKVPQTVDQEDRKEEEEDITSPMLPNRSEPTAVYDPDDSSPGLRQKNPVSKEDMINITSCSLADF